MDKLPIINHVKEIIQLIFPEVAESIQIEVYMDGDEAPSFLAIGKGFVYEATVVLQIGKTDLLPEGGIANLSKLISKIIYTNQDGEKLYLYWFEGQYNDHIVDDTLEEPTKKENIEKIKSETRLPKWLDKYIYDELHAIFEPDFVKFEYNLEHSTEDLLVYMGTYFPRSFAESFCIFDDLFSNKHYNEQYLKKSEVDILDIGCGTGGNLIGLIVAINKHFPHIKELNVYGIDGNPHALELLDSLIDKTKRNYSIKVNCKLFNTAITGILDLNDIVGHLPQDTFDFIMSFKTIVEVINKGNGSNNNAFYQLLEIVSEHLKNEGISIIVDVTTKTSCSHFLPYLLNEQARRFVKSHDNLKILSPLSCNFYGKSCNNNCFSQHEFCVSHKKKNDDMTKIVFKILGRPDFVDGISKDREKGKFIINWKQFSTSAFTLGYCKNSLEGDNPIDAYKLS